MTPDYQWSRGVPGERLLARLVFRFLTGRGWIVQANEPGDCTNVEGWRPLFSIRYGKTPVYRGVGEVRWHG